MFRNILFYFKFRKLAYIIIEIVICSVTPLLRFYIPAFRRYFHILKSQNFYLQFYLTRVTALILFRPRLAHIRTQPSSCLRPHVSLCLERREITSPSVSPEPGHAKPMGALLSKAPPQLLTLINLMWCSVERTVWKSSEYHDLVPCRWTKRELSKLWGGWMRTGARKKDEERKNRLK